jgi:hypothetical protein
MTPAGSDAGPVICKAALVPSWLTANAAEDAGSVTTVIVMFRAGPELGDTVKGMVADPNEKPPIT